MHMKIILLIFICFSYVSLIRNSKTCRAFKENANRCPQLKSIYCGTEHAAYYFQIAGIFIYLQHCMYKWNIQCAVTSNVCHCDYPLLCVLYVILLLHMQYVFVRFMYVNVNGSSITNVVQLKFCLSAFFSLFFQTLKPILAQAASPTSAIYENQALRHQHR